MLVITRKKGEGVVVGNCMVVTVAEQDLDHVTLEVDCREEYSIQMAEGVEPINRGKGSPVFVLPRRKSESFIINQDITVTILDIVRDEKVR